MERRTFLRRSFAAVNAAIGLIVGLPAVRYVLDPLSRTRKDGEFIRVAPLSALSPGRPYRAAVVAERVDAYTRHPPGTLGQVFLIQDGDARNPSVRCLQTICPHFGCSINYLPDRDSFACPCHASDFDKSGRRLVGPAPRHMDALECRVTGPDASGQHWVEVKYEEFAVGKADRTHKT